MFSDVLSRWQASPATWQRALPIPAAYNLAQCHQVRAPTRTSPHGTRLPAPTQESPARLTPLAHVLPGSCLKPSATRTAWTFSTWVAATVGWLGGYRA